MQFSTVRTLFAFSVIHFSFFCCCSCSILLKSHHLSYICKLCQRARMVEWGNVGEQERQGRGKGQKRQKEEEVDSSINTLRKGMWCRPAGAKVIEIHWRSRWYLDLFQVLQRDKKERLRMEPVGRSHSLWRFSVIQVILVFLCWAGQLDYKWTSRQFKTSSPVAYFKPNTQAQHRKMLS